MPNNIGAFGENFPYTNQHDMNMDWVIKIAKEFLDQYSHLQEVLNTGLSEIDTKINEGLDTLQDKADDIETLLNQWYESHSSDIANQLSLAITNFNIEANRIGEEVIESIPDDYTELANEVRNITNTLNSITTTTQEINMVLEQGGISSDGSLVQSDILVRTKYAFTCEATENINLIDSNYEYRIFGLYQGNMQLIKDYDQGNSFTFNVHKDGVKLVIRKVSREAITPEDINLNEIFTTTISSILTNNIEIIPEKIYPIIEQYNEDNVNNMNLTEVGYDFENMIWSWWSYPQVISRNYIRNQAYFGFCTNDGGAGVALYNFDTGERKKTILKKSDIDDHNAPAVFLTNIGRVIVAYSGGHNTDTKMHIRISKSLENIDIFDDVIDIECGGFTTYAQLTYSTDKFYLFFRVNDTAWYYVKSSDLRTWSEPQKLIEAPNIQYYVKFTPTNNDSIIRMVMYSNPSEGHTEIRQGFLNTYTHKVLNSDNTTQLGDDETSYLYSDFNIVVPTGTGKENRLLDVAVTEPQRTVIAYATFTPTLVDDSEYYCYNNGTNKKIVDGGYSFWFPKYQGGVSFITSTKVVVSRTNSGKDKIEIYEFNGTAWNMTQLIYEADNYAESSYPIRNVRPIVDIDRKIILWHSGYYNSGDFTKFDCDAKLHIM